MAEDAGHHQPIDEPPPFDARAPLGAGGGDSLPPLRVHHLLLWMAVASALFAVVFSAIRNSPALDDSGGVLNLLWFLPASAEMSALCVVLAARRSGVAVWQPGHGLLLLSSLSVALHIALWAGVAFDGWRMATAFELYVLLRGVALFAVSLGLARTSKVAAWRVTFLWMAAEPIVGYMLRSYFYSRVGADYQSAVVAAYLAAIVPQLIAIAFVTLGVWSDCRRGAQRHWTHWVGVANVYIYLAVLAVAFAVLYYGPEPTAAAN